MPIAPETREAYFDALRTDEPESLYETAPCGYLSTTPDGLITKANRTMLEMIGRNGHDVVGRLHFTDLLTVGGRIYYETHYSPLLRMHGTAQEIALDMVRADGSHVPVLVNAVLDRGPQGRPTTIRAAVFDATQRRAYERELQRQKERAEEAEKQARELARTLQQTLIPPSPPRVPRLDVGALFRSGAVGVDVGGDFYDVFQISRDEWAVILGDVCGKGIEAATVATLTRYTLRAMCMEHESPSAALRRTNDVLRSEGVNRFCSAVCLRLTNTGGTLWRAAVSTAGHPLPLLRDASGAVREVGLPGTLLNIVEAPEFVDVEVELTNRSALLLYTDGLSEGRAGNEFYGEQRIINALRDGRGSAQTMAQFVMEDNLLFQSGSPRDDVVVLVVKTPT